MTATLSLPNEPAMPDRDSLMALGIKNDTLKVVDFEGKEVIIMKKVCLILMILVLTLTTCFATAATYTLSEKMGKQLEVGSGLKGSFTVHAEGSSELMTLLKNLNDREIQIRSISERDADNGLTSFYVDPGDESQQGLSLALAVTEN